MLIFAENKSEISISYVPWLRNLTKDMHLTYLSGYAKLGRHAVGGALRYFSLGEITFTDPNAQFIRDYKPNEFEITASYAFKLSDRWSVGLNGKFAYSNLTGGTVTEGADSKAAIAGAADLSFTHYNDELNLGQMDGEYTFAITINNIGNKVSYSNTTERDFIPINLKIANALKLKFDRYNDLFFGLEFQKLLVPTPAITLSGKFADGTSGTATLGKSGDVGVIKGMLQSFYDAPGTFEKDDNGIYILSDKPKKGSRLLEELSEINIAFGMEYWYNKLLAIRAGYFFEPRNKGNRQFFSVGAGLRYNRFGIDVSYLAAVGGRRSPLANTLRFTLSFIFSNKNNKASEDVPE
jgi:hypothetical protein